MKTDMDIMEILAAYDLIGSYRKAAELVGCDHHTVRRYVALRQTGADPTAPARRMKMIDEFMPESEELVEASHGRIGADKMAEAVALAKLRGTGAVDRALGAAAMAARFADADLRSILDHQTFHENPAAPSRATEHHSLQPGTEARTGFGE